MGRLDGKAAVVTGAGQGIGRAATLLFAREGARVMALDRNPETLAALAGEDHDIETRLVDVAERDAVEAFAGEAGAVDVLFNCAGIVPVGTVLDCSPQQWDEALAVNVTSMFLTIRSLLPAMLHQGGGSIVNMASVVSSVTGVPNRFAYGASKGAVIGLTKSVAADFAARGVRCNAICPGTVDTPSLAERLAAAGDETEARAAFVARQPMGRLGTTREIAALALHLASDESAYTTGSVHIIDGGMSL